MNNPTVAYCRLCAVLKPVSRLSNLEDNENYAQMIVNKLSRFNITIEFHASILPKTVCTVCTQSLGEAFIFITTVEKAQDTLSDYILVKTETDHTESDEKNIFNEQSDEIQSEEFQYPGDMDTENNVNSDIDMDNYIYVETIPYVNDMEDLSTNDKVDVNIANNDDHSVNDNKRAMNVDLNHLMSDYDFGIDKKYNCSVNVVENTEDSVVNIENNNKEPPACNENGINEHKQIEIGQNEAKTKIVDPPEIKHKCIEHKSTKDSYLEHIDSTTDVEVAKGKNNFMAADGTVKESGIDEQIVNQTSMDASKEKEENDQETIKSVIPPRVKRKYVRRKPIKVLEPKKIEYFPDYIDKQIKRLATIPVQEITKTWTEYNWKCYFCETLFPNIEELRTHSIEYHGYCNPYICSEGCHGRNYRLNRFIKHVRRHNKHLHYSCYICFEKFSNPLQTSRHKRIHINTEFVCEGCNTPFPSKAELSEHEEKYFQKLVRIPVKDQNYMCGICEKTLITRTGFINHMDSHNGIKKRQYVCDICGKSFVRKANLEEHTIYHSDAKPHECVICKRAFKTLSQLRFHAGTHSDAKPFQCDHCGKRFRLRSYIINHLITHSGKFPYSCMCCNKRFSRSVFLKNHSLQHTGVKPFTCEICPRSFTNWGNWKKHMKRKHSTDKTERNRTPQGPHAGDSVTEAVIYPEIEKTIVSKKKIDKPMKTKKTKKNS